MLVADEMKCYKPCEEYNDEYTIALESWCFKPCALTPAASPCIGARERCTRIGLSIPSALSGQRDSFLQLSVLLIKIALLFP